MNISNFKDLEKLIKLCRKTGVEIIEVDGIKMQLSHLPVMDKSTHKSRNPVIVDESAFDPGHITVPQMPIDSIDTDELTDEQKLFGSSDPSVWNTPTN